MLHQCPPLCVWLVQWIILSKLFGVICTWFVLKSRLSCSVFIGHSVSPFLRRLCVFQGSDVGHGEVWLVLTDPSLQEEKPDRPCRRTVALCVSTSCALTSSVVRALGSSAACRMSFRDVVRDHGRSLLQHGTRAQRCTDYPKCTAQWNLSTHKPAVAAVLLREIPLNALNWLSYSQRWEILSKYTWPQTVNSWI